MLSDLLTWGLLGLTGYAGVPTLLMRLGYNGAIRRGEGGQQQVSLTFDDGPDPRYTPRILEALAQQGVRACFFMLGRKAEAYPDLVRRVVEAGHEVGVHGYRHVLQAVMGRRSTEKEIQRTSRILTEITGERPRFFRPPWGVFNLWTAFLPKRLGLTPVVWSGHARDWICAAAPTLHARVMKRLTPGAVLLLHDGAGPGAQGGAPDRLADALPMIIDSIRRSGYTLVPLSQLGREEAQGVVPSV